MRRPYSCYIISPRKGNGREMPTGSKLGLVLKMMRLVDARRYCRVSPFPNIERSFGRHGSPPLEPHNELCMNGTNTLESTQPAHG